MVIINLISSIVILNLIHNIYVYMFKIEVVQRHLKRHSRWLELENIIEFRKYKIKEKVLHILIVLYFLVAINILSVKTLSIDIIGMHFILFISIISLERYVNYRLQSIKRNINCKY